MSKKRLYKKNIKTKKKMKGGEPGQQHNSDLYDARIAAETTKKKEDFSSAANNAKNIASSAADNAKNIASSAADNAKNIADNAKNIATADASQTLTNVANNPFAKFGKGALDTLKKGLQFIKGSLTPEDEYRHALLKLRKNPGFKNYFATAVNKVIVFNFYNVLIELGKYSRNYSDISKKFLKLLERICLMKMMIYILY